MPKTHNGKSNRNRHSSTQAASSANQHKLTTSIQQETSDTTTVSIQQQATMSSFTLTSISTPDTLPGDCDHWTAYSK